MVLTRKILKLDCKTPKTVTDSHMVVLTRNALLCADVITPNGMLKPNAYLVRFSDTPKDQINCVTFNNPERLTETVAGFDEVVIKITLNQGMTIVGVNRWTIQNCYDYLMSLAEDDFDRDTVEHDVSYGCNYHPIMKHTQAYCDLFTSIIPLLTKSNDTRHSCIGYLRINGIHASIQYSTLCLSWEINGTRYGMSATI